MSRSYGSILPTSLTHIVLSARGFSPRRPAAVVGTTDGTSHHWVFFRPTDFQGSSRAHRTPHQWRRSAGPSGLSPVRPLPGPSREPPVNKRRQLLPGPSPTSPSSFSVVADSILWLDDVGSGISTRFPFTAQKACVFCLGSTHPRAIAVDAEPSSTSAFQGLVRIVATTTKIGTGGRSGPARARTFSTPTAAPSYSQSTSSCSAAGHGWRRLSALHFQGRSLRQVSCYTLLGGCRLPWPPSCCLERSTPFCGI